MAEENKQTPGSGDILDTIDNKMSKVDKIFDHFGIIWKKHWGKIIILTTAASIYFFMKWAMSLPEVPVQDSTTEQTEQVEQYIPEDQYQQTEPATYTEEYVDSTAMTEQ